MEILAAISANSAPTSSSVVQCDTSDDEELNFEEPDIDWKKPLLRARANFAMAWGFALGTSMTNTPARKQARLVRSTPPPPRKQALTARPTPSPPRKQALAARPTPSPPGRKHDTSMDADTEEMDDSSLLAEAYDCAPLPHGHHGITGQVRAMTKKPSAHIKSKGCMKKPSAPSMTIECTKPVRALKMNRHCVHSRAWHGEMKIHRARGTDIEEAKALAKEAARVAVEAFQATLGD